MKLIFKGSYTKDTKLPEAHLPYRAIRYREPETTAAVNISALAYAIPAAIVAIIIIGLQWLLHGTFMFEFNLWGVVAAFMTIIPHEFIHALCFPKNSDVYMYYSLKDMMAFVTCTAPMSKRRFIIMSLLPNAIFGLLPMLFWMIFPDIEWWSSFIGTTGLVSLFFGCGDYMNVGNTIRQVPEGAITQLSGFHSYWYTKE